MTRWRRAVWLLCFAAGMMLTSTGAAAEPPDAGAPSWLAQNRPSQTSDQTSVPVGRVLALLALTGSLVGAAWCVRRRRTGTARIDARRRLQVLDSVRVGPKAQLVMVSIGGKTMLLGVTESSVRRLAWTAAAEPEASEEPLEPQTTLAFTSVLRDLSKPENRDASHKPEEQARTRSPTASTSALRSTEDVSRLAARGGSDNCDAVEGQVAGLAAWRARRRA